MKSLLKKSGVTLIFALVVFLTACTNQPAEFDLELENGDEIAIETDLTTITYQEVFEMIANRSSDGFSVSLWSIFDWADYILLNDLFEADEDFVDENMLQVVWGFPDEDDLEDALIAEGIDTMENLERLFRLQSLRLEAARSSIEISEEEIIEAYEQWFVAPPELDEYGEVIEDEEAEAITLETMDPDNKEEVINFLEMSAMGESGLQERVISELREEAGFTLYSQFYVDNYIAWLELHGVDAGHVGNAGSTDEAIIASINDEVLTIDAFFNDLLKRQALIGHSPILTYIDTQILSERFEADMDVVQSNLTQAKIDMADMFFPQMEMQGLTTEEEIEAHFLLSHLKELAIEDAFPEPDPALIQQMFDTQVEQAETHNEQQNRILEAREIPKRGARHILVRDNRELAEDIIAQLQAVDADEVEDLFKVLAEEHGTDGTAQNGGDLGTFMYYQMAPEFTKAVFYDLELGEFSPEPVLTDFGYHVIMVYYVADEAPEEPEDGWANEPNFMDIPVFEEMEPQLIEVAMAEYRHNPAFLTAILRELRAEFGLTIHNELLTNVYEAIGRRNTRQLEAMGHY